MNRPGTPWIAAIFFVCSLLSGCVQIVQPNSGQSFPYPAPPIQATIGFRSPVCPGTFQVTLDGNNVTGQFSPQPPANTEPQATFTNLAPGSHTLSVNVQTLQYWFLIPYCGSASDSVTFSIQAPPLPKLAFSPVGPLTINAGSSSSENVTSSAAPSSATTISLSVSSFSAAVPGSTSIASGQTTSSSFSVTGQSAGSATVTAAASGFQSATLSVAVKPVITKLNPTSGLRGTSITITGVGFAAGSTLNFGCQNVTATFISSTQLTVSVPSCVSPGTLSLQVTTNGQQSNSATFTVLPTEVVLAASANNQFFVTIDFTKTPPATVDTNIPYSGGSVLTCSGSTVAVGNRNGSQVVLFNISNPAAPAQLGQPIPALLSGISAIKLNSNRVLAGELNGSRVVLIDVTNPTSPVVGTPITTQISSVTSTGLSGSNAVVAGTNNFPMDIMNVSNPSQPTQTSFDPGLGGGLKTALDGTSAAAGSPLGSTVKLVNITVPSDISSVNSGLNGVFSIAIKGSKVVAGSSNSFNAALIDFTNLSNPVVTPINPGNGGGWNVTMTATRVALGNITGNNVDLFDISGSTPVSLGNAITGLNSIGNVCISDF